MAILGQRKTSLVVFLWKRRTSSVVFLAKILFIMATKDQYGPIMLQSVKFLRNESAEELNKTMQSN